MAKEFFHPDMELFVDHRVDWERYLRLSRREAADVTGEIDTYKMILRTLAEICEDIDARTGEHWHEEVRVEDGRVVVPPHVAQAYEKLGDRVHAIHYITKGVQKGYSMATLKNEPGLEGLLSDPNFRPNAK